MKNKQKAPNIARLDTPYTYWQDPATIIGYKKGKVIYIEHP